ncbi:hypothetical protein BCR44DRAFT_1444953 [Catenaria anguillulae PL171]|uniref:Uncharacterized protein n=1 Tax=Catenaria anguillulae PL171 TaxID=765915 RepID=A0A1Y2H722_9FUNG|nr:hypothetical protein BCR44DRAFT_1444953 [Catenaria anguillulae PL171]
MPMDVTQLGGVLDALHAPLPTPGPAPPDSESPPGLQSEMDSHVGPMAERPLTMTRPLPPGANGARGRHLGSSANVQASVAGEGQGSDAGWQLVQPAPAALHNKQERVFDVDETHLVRSTSPSPSPSPPQHMPPNALSRGSLPSLATPATAPTSGSTATRVYDLEHQLDELRSALYDRDARLRVQADTLARLQSKLDASRHALEAAEDREHAHVAEVGAYRGELARMQRLVGEHVAEVERVKREADEREARWVRMEAEVAVHRAQNAELRGLLNKSVERERELSSVVERGKRELGRLVERCERLEVENEELHVECKNGEEERRAEVERIRGELGLVKEEWTREKAERSKAEAEAARLRAVANASLMDSGRLSQSAPANSQATSARAESTDSIDHEAPEPLAHAPQPSSRAPSPPPAGSLAAEFRMSASPNDGDTSWALVPPSQEARARSSTSATVESTATDEMAVARNLTQAYEADLGKTKLALIASQERCLELEQLVDALRDQVARADRESKERLSVMGEALQDAQRDVAVAKAEVERVSAEREALEKEWRGLQEVVKRVRRQQDAEGHDKLDDPAADAPNIDPCQLHAAEDADTQLLAPLVISPVPDLGLRRGKWYASLRAISTWSHRLMSLLGYLAVLTWAFAVAQHGIVVGGDPQAVPAYMLDPNPDLEYLLRPYEVKCDGLVSGWVCRMLAWRQGVEEPLG